MCLDTKSRFWTDANLWQAWTYSAPCVDENHADKDYQTIQIKERGSDRKLVFFSEPGIGFSYGSSIGRTTRELVFMAFNIFTVTVPPTATPTPTGTPTNTPTSTATPTITPTPTVTNTPTPTPVINYTPLSATANNDLIGVDLQIKVVGTSSCVDTEWHDTQKKTGISRAPCDSSKDSQAWKIVSYDGAWQIQSKAGNGGTAYSTCIDTHGWEDDDDYALQGAWVWSYGCYDASHQNKEHQKFEIEKRDSDNKWVFWANPGVGLEDYGEYFFFGLIRTGYATFEITPVSQLSTSTSTPTPTPTPQPMPTATPTPTPSATATPTPTPTPEATATPTPTPTPTTTSPAVAISSDLLNVDAQIKVDGVKGCFDVKYGNPYNGQNVWRYGCNGTDAQTWQISEFNGGYQIKVKSAPQNGNEYTVCLDSRGDHDNDDLTGSRVDVWACIDENSGAADNQTFWIEEATDGDGTYHIFSHEDVGIRDQGDAQNFTHDGSNYTEFEITAVTGGL